MNDNHTPETIPKDEPTTTNLKDTNITDTTATFGNGGYTTTVQNIVEIIYEYATENDARVPVTPTVHTQSEGYMCGITITVFTNHPYGLYVSESLKEKLPDEATVSTNTTRTGHSEHAELINWATQQNTPDKELPEIVKNSMQALAGYHTDTEGYYKTTVSVDVTASAPNYI